MWRGGLEGGLMEFSGAEGAKFLEGGRFLNRRGHTEAFQPIRRAQGFQRGSRSALRLSSAEGLALFHQVSFEGRIAKIRESG